MAVNYVLYESAVGYSIFDVIHQIDSVGLELPEFQQSLKAIDKFSNMVKLRSFAPWQSAAQGLEAVNMISEGIVTNTLKNFLELNLPQTSGKKSKVVLGLNEPKLASEINMEFPGITCEAATTNDVVHALLRGIRLHAPKLLKDLQEGDMDRASLGLGHAYSRAKVKFSVHKNDNHIIQGIATLDALDKGINQGAMRVREWYGWHFPELVKIVSDNGNYCKLVVVIGNKNTLTDERHDEIADALNQNQEKADAIISAARISMGQEIAALDLKMITDLATIVVEMTDFRRILSESLDNKMGNVAPNLQTILGTPVAARLISHAGSLTNLSKYPASTLQILGAEKALFRALKTKGATPKYGLLYQSSYIGRAGPKVKGRISRYLANKCSIASRIDNFSEHPTNRFGEVMREQLEERLQWFASGAKPTSNADAMQKAIQQVLGDEGGDMDIDEEMIDHPKGALEQKASKKEKKSKNRKKSLPAEDIEMADAAEEAPKEKKKEKKRKSLVDAAGTDDAPKAKKSKKDKREKKKDRKSLS